jgi:methane monooxygenase component A beta chain/propane monooxygenase small subunit
MTTTAPLPHPVATGHTEGEGFGGNRHFTFFRPKKRKPTDYESFTLGQHLSPATFIQVDWPVRFDDGTEPFREESTALRCGDWEAFRDPAQTWQRDYVDSHNSQERALAVTSHALVSSGVLAGINPVWRDRVLAEHLAAYPFVSYAQFLALSYAVREALTSALTFALAFEAQDNLRHLQDVVHATFDLKEAFPDWTDDGARGAWMTAPEWQPARQTIEAILALEDWGEILVALNLVVEPLLGRLVKRELLARNAARNGDPLTTVITATMVGDCEHHLRWTEELIRTLLADPDHGSHNRTVITGWLEKWTPLASGAVDAFAPVFAIPGLVIAETFDSCSHRLRAEHRSLCAGLTLEVSEAR